MSEFGREPGPDQPPYVSVTVLSERQSLPEVIEALWILDRTWTLAVGLATVDEALQSFDALEMFPDPPTPRTKSQQFARPLAVQPDEIGALRSSYAGERTVLRPRVSLSKQSPLVVELSGWIAGGSLGGVAAWQAFKYLVSNAESIAGLPHRLRSGWFLSRTNADDASLVARAVRMRRKLLELELAEAEQVEDIARALRGLGPLDVASNVSDDQSFS
ncbi:hypothetical protein [Aeromicrobium duanguangcaii]|uniref:Uncharacterized protein n=1 Tax=Aeromicrobium duanguangcaii TaxID=2968086 RepID=A0ABY5KIZ8_9ACTN|nr:hypothetical protein [Aeromicrobium duanguangcaii]MCD9152936.1 hypothetical protein [Aeromicrobium duanguangcaii]UUI69958.1 hypothetical protein NP095_07645 [Aeromicrobium duanguangcaii]